MPDRRGVRQIQISPAARADLNVELYRLVAVGALTFGFVLLDPVEDHRDQPEDRQHQADQQPDPERAALGAADDRGGEAEEEGDDRVLEAHCAPIVAVSPSALARAHVDRPQITALPLFEAQPAPAGWRAAGPAVCDGRSSRARR